jgi:putative oxidoreductase
VLIGSLFVLAGPAKIMAPVATAGYMATGGLPQSPLLAVAVGIFEVLGGLAIVFGYRTRIVSFALALFTLWATMLFHNFWASAADQQFVQHLLFSKNIAIVGALLYLSAMGAGSWSVDSASNHRVR